jgi:CBS-domain-containing membrane protein
MQAPTLQRLKLRWRIIRARTSLPALLANHDERSVLSTVCTLNAVVAIALLGFVSWLAGLPLLFPALGPTAFIQYSSPFSPAASPRSVIMGHLIAIGAGHIGWNVFHTFGIELFGPDAAWVAIAAASLALALTSFLMIRLECAHPPACGTALILALGKMPTLFDMGVMIAAVVLMAAMTSASHRLCGVNAQKWSIRRPAPRSSVGLCPDEPTPHRGRRAA